MPFLYKVRRRRNPKKRQLLRKRSRRRKKKRQAQMLAVLNVALRRRIGGDEGGRTPVQFALCGTFYMFRDCLNFPRIGTITSLYSVISICDNRLIERGAALSVFMMPIAKETENLRSTCR